MTLQAALYESYIQNNGRNAIITDKYSISYKELFERGNSIRVHLSNTLHFTNKIIPLLFVTSEHYIYGILGVLYSKNIFMLLDATHPIEKLIDCILTLECDFLITDKNVSSHLIKIIRKINVNILFIEDLLLARASSDMICNFLDYHEEDAIYIYFTSGSMGKGKAVLGRNKSLLHFVKWEIKEFNTNVNDIFAQMTSPAFDPYLRDIFTPLCSGAKIRLVNRNIALIPRLFGDFLNGSLITYLHTTPLILRSLLSYTFCKDHFKNLKYMLIAGEVLSPELVKDWYAKYSNHTTLVNLYGPTETTLAKVFARVPSDFSDEIVPVGKPISDTKLYIMNDNASLECGSGESGEVYIETEYMSHGYYNDKYNPSFCINHHQKRWYATGDLGYIIKGNLFLVGRKDDQKKIGGVRIDLNEIKSTILAYSKEKIENCVVLHEGDLLIAFYIASASTSIDSKDMRSFLETRLLPIHIPHKFIRVNHFPLTVNGKLDKNQLLSYNDKH